MAEQLIEEQGTDLLHLVKAAEERLYDVYRVKVKFRPEYEGGVLYGGVPKNPEVIKGWLQQRKKAAIKAGHEITPEVSEAEVKEITDHVDIDEDKTWTTFLKNENGLFVTGYQWKACLRETATTLGITALKFAGNRGFRQFYQHGLHVRPWAIYLDREEPDGCHEIVGQIKDSKGERSIVRRADFVVNVEMEFDLYSAAVNILDDELLASMLAKAGENGFGSMRSREVGKFDLTGLHKIREVQALPDGYGSKSKSVKKEDKSKKK